MPWAVAAAVVGGAISSKASSKASKAQAAIADKSLAAGDRALEQQIAQADELMQFNYEQFDYNRGRQDKVDLINEKVTNQNLDLSAKAGKRADEAYDFYQQNGRPVVQKTLQEAQDYDSVGNIQNARNRAASDVQQGFDASQEQSNRTLTRMGVNPSSGRFLALQQRLQADKALAVAGSQTNAEQGIRDQAIGLRQQASNLAQGFPAQSMAQAGQSSGFGVAGAGVAGAGMGQNIALSQSAMSGMATGSGIYGDAARGYGNIYSTAMNGMASAQNAGAANAAGWGNLAGMGLSQGMKNWNAGGGAAWNGAGNGMFSGAQSGDVGFADGGKIAGPQGGGGKVKGPGTGTSDQVPARNGDTGQPIRLSNGEYVLSADTVKALGTKYLDNLQAKHHKPVNLRSAA